MARLPSSKYGVPLVSLLNPAQMQGWAGPAAADKAWRTMSGRFPSLVVGGTANGDLIPDFVYLWETYKEVTGEDPDTTPQPTGNCVSASTDDGLECLQATLIAAKQRLTWERIYNPYHYGTARVLVGKKAIRGPGLILSWQIDAVKTYGTLALQPDLPRYTKYNVDAWGDDKQSDDGDQFRNHLETGKQSLLRTAAKVGSLDELSLAMRTNKCPAVVASSCGYSMLPNRDGFHVPEGVEHHAQSIWGIDTEAVYIKNQWGDVHGRVKTKDGRAVPPGFRKVRLDVFAQRHLRASGAECFVLSGYDGFPAVTIETKGWA